MNSENRPLLLLLALAASSMTAPSGEARAAAVPATSNPSDVVAALRSVAQERLAGFVMRPEHPPSGTQTAQFYNFPNFPNYFYNCIRGWWRNC